MSRLKVVITGPFNSGKTQYIRTLSEIDVVTTERKITSAELASVKGETTVAMDFGKVTRGDDKIYLFGTPGQAQFQIMWEVLTENMLGFIVIVDSTDKSRLDNAREIIKSLSSWGRTSRTCRMLYRSMSSRRSSVFPMMPLCFH
jgi:signal recognition particle receptor subunit beta